MSELLWPALVGIVVGAFTTYRLLASDHKRLLEENLTMRHNILTAQDFEDWRLLKYSLIESPIPRLEDLRQASE